MWCLNELNSVEQSRILINRLNKFIEILIKAELVQTKINALRKYEVVVIIIYSNMLYKTILFSINFHIINFFLIL